MDKRDVTIKSVEEENRCLKKQNELMLTILDGINDAVYAVDENDKITIYNSRVEQAEGKKRSDTLGRDEKEVYKYDDNTFNEQVTMKVKETGKPLLQTIFRYHTDNGRLHTIIANSFPFFYEGKYAGTYTIGQDLKLIHEVYDNLVLRQQKLIKAVEDSTYKGGISYVLDDIIGKSRPIRDVISLSKKVASRDSALMIIGETGTGKEMFAQGIHYASMNRRGPFVPVNCAAIPESLLEGILFGTEKGAFTGAIDMPGLFEQAENGTIFLDEINSMSFNLQAKLLRVLQDKKVRRVGSQKEITVNCRIISASNTDLSDRDEFRSDLFFRLAVVTLNLPPLRDRQDDILILAYYFIDRFNQRFGTHIKEIDEELRRILYIYSWPGNVRELENLIESAMNFVEGNEDILRFDHFPEFFQEKLLRVHLRNKYLSPDRPKTTLRSIMREYEKKVILETLRCNNYNVSRAARELGLQRQNLQAKMRTYEIIKP